MTGKAPSLRVIFVLTCFVLVVFGSNQPDFDLDLDLDSNLLESRNDHLNSSQSLKKYLQGIFNIFKVIQDENAEQEKVIVELKEQLKLLKDETDEIKRQIGKNYRVLGLPAEFYNLTSVTSSPSPSPSPTTAKIATRGPDPCDTGSCYPASGNLLVGREARISASSTCGLNGEERYCITSRYEGRKNCYRCDSAPELDGNPTLSHRVENILTRFYPGSHQRSWWQSENGVENVTIQLDLEAEFHFTYLSLTFKTYRPAAMLIERSSDYGKTWKVYRYFAHDCEESFPGIPKAPPKAVTDVFCESRYSAVTPSTEGEVLFRLLPGGIPISDPHAPEILNLLKITNLRINFTKFHTLGDDDLLDKQSDAKEKYYYAIYEMVVRGSCSCNGHAMNCLPISGAQTAAPAGMIHGRCDCKHNTTGLNCEECAEFHKAVPWKRAIGKQANACRRSDNSTLDTKH